MTTFLVHAPIAGADLAERLGQPEYSYAFVLARFRPVLEQLGTVIDVTDPVTEVDPLYDRLTASGEAVVFLCFAPPHRAPTGLRCPTSTVFAWEFETIPDHEWDGEPRHDWRRVLADHGRAIVLSTHTADAIRRAMGPEFPVAAIPAPLFERFTGGSDEPRDPPLGPRELTFDGLLIDHQDFEYTDEGMAAPSLAERFPMAPWNGRPVELEFTTATEDHGYLVGFYRAEAWGTWTRVAQPWVMLPVSVNGPVQVDLAVSGHTSNVGRAVTASLGGSEASFIVPPPGSHISLRFDVPEPTNVLQFSGLLAEVPPGATDQRTMAIGLSRLVVRRPSPVPPRAARLLRRARARAGLPLPQRPAVRAARQRLALDGVVYTSVFNPVDYRKNWEQLLYAFCWAFREEPDATLVLKMTHRSVAAYFADLQYFLHRVGPTRCRIVVVQGFLSDSEFAQLMGVTTFYANASSAEGLCMPLMEFMSAGVPAVATDNTAMADYVTGENAFPVRSVAAYTHWPHDDRQLVRAVHHRVDWRSLVDAFSASYDVARTDPQHYRAMSAAARDSQRDFCSDAAVGQALQEFLDAIWTSRA